LVILDNLASRETKEIRVTLVAVVSVGDVECEEILEEKVKEAMLV